jgi:hypothetical protein
MAQERKFSTFDSAILMTVEDREFAQARERRHGASVCLANSVDSQLFPGWGPKL